MADESCIYAKLTPSNVAAKLAFSAVADSLLTAQQPLYHRSFMDISSTKQSDAEVAAFLSRNQDASLSDTPTEPDTETEREWEKDARLSIWTGSYIIDLRSEHVNSSASWTAGRGRTGAVQDVQFLLCPRKQKAQVRGIHAHFTVHPDTGFIRVQQRQINASTCVNGEETERAIHINGATARIAIGDLMYNFAYAG
ncbi:hypothetical protein BU26DRAFT_556128 [Trematosphaeria pertusa]|uniref:FHA domain-containing protein n=1 Tax=Trematosphaeria pertusa TaxID=390896 RepID=A0A6A6HUS6_9PLEO|nr:uncharacterized protein BU26DRAFT_556128 [Trematosphaeria pertusa]KAF2241303.1 hypothetical protein BU26DRAFT_556128 [Trematosphaeria pertusa]